MSACCPHMVQDQDGLEGKVRSMAFVGFVSFEVLQFPS